MIRVDHLTKQYGSQRVLDDITTEFMDGAIYGLVGVNGSGKTTLMRCICGFAQPTKGHVFIDDKEVGKDMDFPAKTGIIIEGPGFLPQYSGFRNLKILANISGGIGDDRVKQVIKMLGLDPEDKKPVAKYSLGMRQRLGIAQALMEDPDILILDEPFNGLDQEGMEDIHKLLKELKSKGKLVILASHSAHDIQMACDIVYEIRKGKLLTRTPDESVYITKAQ